MKEYFIIHYHNPDGENRYFTDPTEADARAHIKKDGAIFAPPLKLFRTRRRTRKSSTRGKKRMNKRKRQISKAIHERIRAEHNAMMEELFAYMDEVFAEMEEEANEV